MDEATARVIAERRRSSERVPEDAVCGGVEKRLIRLGQGPDQQRRERAYVVRFITDTPHKGHWVEIAVGENASILRVERCL